MNKGKGVRSCFLLWGIGDAFNKQLPTRDASLKETKSLRELENYEMIEKFS